MQPVLLHKAVFFDKDGTLIHDVPHNVDRLHVRFREDAFEALASLQDLGFKLFVVTNQGGIARGLFSSADVEAVGHYLTDELADRGIRLSGFYYCPHDEQGSVPHFAVRCSCRKPKPGLLHQAALDHHLDLAASWMVGDILHDVEAGNRAGCRSILLDVGNETEWLSGPHRQPTYFADSLLSATQHIQQKITRYLDTPLLTPKEVIA